MASIEWNIEKAQTHLRRASEQSMLEWQSTHAAMATAYATVAMAMMQKEASEDSD